MKPMKFKGTLTPETLMDEFTTWVKVNGKGRDKNDIRFGQYIVNTYLNPGCTFSNLHCVESASLAYTIALDELMYG